jgi:hypothetical protein
MSDTEQTTLDTPTEVYDDLTDLADLDDIDFDLDEVENRIAPLALASVASRRLS